MTQIAIPCLMLRGGTSKGPYFNAKDLPSSVPARDLALLAAMGSPDDRQIDGLGGADSLTSKVAIVAKSARPDVDVDYTFAQVAIGAGAVDTGPSCGNMLAGVGPYAIETGLVLAADGETTVIIHDANTGSRIEAIVQTPGGRVTYVGDAVVDGVPGPAAPVQLDFTGITGSKTGALLPTGKVIEDTQGIEVSLVDAATPMVLFGATDLGLTGNESREAINANEALFNRVEAIRLEAGRRMGLGDVSGKVIPKVGLLAAPVNDGDIRSIYLTPWRAHAAHAVTGALCVAAASAIDGTIAHSFITPPVDANIRTVRLEHPSGHIAIKLATTGAGADLNVIKAGVIRTARLIMRGEVMIPAATIESATLAA
jgi:4-oxalomesaconate tautomerase